MWATRGTFGVVPPELDGHFATNEFPMFASRDDKLSLPFLALVAQSPAFLADVDAAAVGSTDRRRLHPERFLELEIARRRSSEYHRPVHTHGRGLEAGRKPFPPEGIRRPGKDEPFSPDVFPDETADFKRKLVRGAIQGQRGVGFLWSQGPGGDTGYGKTTLMLAAAREINDDLGKKVLLTSAASPGVICPSGTSRSQPAPRRCR